MIFCTNNTIISFLFTGFPDVENEGNDQGKRYVGIYLCIIPVMNVARKELKALIPQRLHIPSTQLRLLDSVGHGNDVLKVASYNYTLFCRIIL